jgi:hypothetical protein
MQESSHAEDPLTTHAATGDSHTIIAERVVTKTHADHKAAPALRRESPTSAMRTRRQH